MDDRNKAITAHLLKTMYQNCKPINVDEDSDEDEWREKTDEQAPAVAASSTSGTTITKTTWGGPKPAPKLEPTTPHERIYDMTEHVMVSTRLLTFEVANREQHNKVISDTEKR